MRGYVGMLCLKRLQSTGCDVLEGADVALLEFRFWWAPCPWFCDYACLSVNGRVSDLFCRCKCSAWSAASICTFLHIAYSSRNFREHSMARSVSPLGWKCIASTFPPNAPRFPKGHWLLVGSQGSPICSSGQSNMYWTKMSMGHWWNDANKGKPKSEDIATQ